MVNKSAEVAIEGQRSHTRVIYWSLDSRRPFGNSHKLFILEGGGPKETYT